MTTLKVQDLMTGEVLSIHKDEDLSQLMNVMNEIHVRHVPVVDDDGELQGLVSQRDLVAAALFVQRDLPQSQIDDLLRSMKVEEIMVTGIETAEADLDIQEAGQIMLDNKLGCLPVVEGNKLVGILTEADFVKYIVKREA